MADISKRSQSFIEFITRQTSKSAHCAFRCQTQMDTEIGRVDKFSGRLRVPPDKSLTHRAVFLSSLADGDSTIENPLTADDCLSTLRCMEQLGCRMKIRKNQWTVTGHGLWNLKSYSKPLDCGNSGTTMRLLSGILAAQDFESV